jgi:hypothetical protein
MLCELIKNINENEFLLLVEMCKYIDLHMIFHLTPSLEYV